VSWVKVSDEFATHPKVQAAGQAAAWLHVAGLCYAAQHLTDGAIPDASLAGLGQYTRARARKLADRLVEVGLWERNGTGYAIHDYLEYNPSRKSLEERRENNRRAGQAGGLAKAKQRG
jgi:hypothetical protein